MKSNLVEEAEDYKWSSYREYIEKNSITDTAFFLNMLDTNQKKAKKYFIEELKKQDKGIVYLTASNIRRADIEAEKIIYDDMKKLEIECIGEITAEQRIVFIKSLKAKGLTNRQIMSITGLPKSKVIGI